jgi:hypothetical protein
MKTLRLIVASLIIGLLAACGNDMRAGTTPPPSATQQRLTELRTAYLGANLAIAAYALLPTCGDAPGGAAPARRSRFSLLPRP